MLKPVKKTIVGILLFLIVLGVSFYLFTMQINQLVTQRIESRLIDVAESSAKSMELVFNEDIQLLIDRAKFWENGEVLTSEKSLQYLSDIGANTDYVRVGLDLPSGISYTSDGNILDIPDMGYLNKVWVGQTVLTCLPLSKADIEPNLAIAVPVYRNGKIIAAMRGVYSSSFLTEVVNLRTFDGQGYFTLINNDGEFLIKSSKMQQYSQVDNVFELLKTASFSDPFNLEKMRSEIAGQESGFSVYELDDEKRCTYYTPVGLEHWYMISAVPMEYLLQQKMDINLSVG